jgi:O-antigen/teichoic acid export membrane protein
MTRLAPPPCSHRGDGLGSRAHATALTGMVAAEVLSGLLGFLVTVRLARQLGPQVFARLEFALAVSAWLLVLVRSGIEQIVWREAARRPRLIRPFSNLLLGLKSASAVLGYGLVVTLAIAVGGEGGWAIAVAGLVLPVSAFLADVGPRALGCFGPVALGQVVRVVGLAATVTLFVSGSGGLLAAAWCGVISEMLGIAVPTVWHVRRFGLPRPTYQRRTWAVLLRRGTIASFTRFGRVTLYGIDLLILGWLGNEELGSYAAARRVVFALVAAGLVVPTVFAPMLARARTRGTENVRRLIGRASALLLAGSVPLMMGLLLGRERWMPLLFGPDYRGTGSLLFVIAARLPWLLLASLGVAALVSCRREDRALLLVSGMLVAAALTVPLAASVGGASTAGWALVANEAAGAVAAYGLLRADGIHPPFGRAVLACVVGVVLMIVASRIAQSWPDMPFAVFLSTAYSLAWVPLVRSIRMGGFALVYVRVDGIRRNPSPGGFAATLPLGATDFKLFEANGQRDTGTAAKPPGEGSGHSACLYARPRPISNRSSTP